jgi:hypothetical protein
MPLLGHGGSGAADYVQKNLFENLIKHPDFLTNTHNAIGILEIVFMLWDIMFHVKLSVLICL